MILTYFGNTNTANKKDNANGILEKCHMSYTSV